MSAPYSTVNIARQYKETRRLKKEKPFGLARCSVLAEMYSACIQPGIPTDECNL